MRISKKPIWMVVALAVLVAGAPLARATIVNGAPIYVSDQAGTWTITGESYVPPSSPAQLVLTEEANDLGPFDIVITADAPNGSVEFDLVKEILNETDAAWLDFHLMIGTGTADQFVVSSDSDQLWFYGTNDGGTVPQETTGQFQNPPDEDDASAPDTLGWYGSQPIGATSRFVVGIRAPDDIDGVDDGQAVFTVRQLATVPEPATLSLVGLGALALLRRRRRR